MSQSLTAASVEGNKSAVFYVNQNGFIAVYRAQDQLEKPGTVGGRKYSEDFVYPVGANRDTSLPLKSTGKDLAAISYYDDAASRVSTRLYYINTDNILFELCKDGSDGQWYDGILNTFGVACKPNTSLAAMEDFQTDPTTKQSIKLLKVFYFGQSNRVNVAWATINKGDWNVNKEIQ